MGHNNIHASDFASDLDFPTQPSGVGATENPPGPHRSGERRKIEDYWEAKRLAYQLNDDLFGEEDE